MIAKGTLHNNGVRLARYMLHAKPGERVEVGELRGFATDNLVDAFQSIDVMAEATQGEKPFFHVQVRNPEGEELTRAQWRRVADRVESELGLQGQPRAITFHINKTTGHEHMHLAFSRVDEATLTMKPLPYFKLRLKSVSRDLERELDLTRVRNTRDGDVRPALRKEEEQARRLGTDLKQVRAAIRACYDQTSDGPEFVAALAEDRLTLARGDRRALVVVDERGGIHALGKRILGVGKADMLKRMHGLDLEALPTVDEARQQQQLVQTKQRDKGDRGATWKAQYAALDSAATAVRTAETFYFDRDQQARQWEAGLHDAALAFDRQQEAAARRTLITEARQAERRAAYVEERSAAKARNETVQTISTAYASTTTGPEFVTELERRGLTFVRVSEREAERSQAQRDYLHRTPAYEPGEYLVLNERGRAFRLDGTTIHDDETAIRSRLAQIDASQQLTLVQARDYVAYQRGDTEPARAAPLLPQATQRARDLMRGGMDVAGIGLTVSGSAARVAASFLSDIGGGLADFFTGSSKAQSQAPAPSPTREAAPSRTVERLRAPELAPDPERAALNATLQRLRDQTPRAADVDIVRRKDKDRDPGRDR